MSGRENADARGDDEPRDEPRDEALGEVPGEVPTEELRALRDAWSALEPPAADAAGGDPLERAASAWARAAWEALEAPRSRAPLALRRRTARARRARLLPLALAGGAGALAAASVLALVLALRERAREHAPRLVHEGGASSPPHEPRASEPPAAELDGTIQVAAIEEGRMELRSGSVRLILLDEWTEAPAERADAR